MSGTHHDLDELGGGRFRHTQYLKPVRYVSAGGILRPIVNNFVSGDASFPHVVTEAPMTVYVAANGNRRICPTRDPARYVEIGAPYIKPAATWQRVNLGAATRTANQISWNVAQAAVTIRMGGHKIDLDAEFLGGWRPPNNQIAFPVGMSGLTRIGMTFYQDGVPVLTLDPMQMIDLANPGDSRPVSIQLVKVSSQWYAVATIPDLTGMMRPALDPTLTLQPDATAGLDTYISDNATTTNYGTNSTFRIGESNGAAAIRRSLIKFDLSTLPADAAISSATLSMRAVNDFSSNARTYRVFRQSRAWTEAGATWNKYDGTNDWATAGGFGATDCEQTDIGSRDLTATETVPEFKDFVLTPTTKAGLDLGNGWLVKADTESDDMYDFYSSDWATAADRPKLVVEYTTPSGGQPTAIRGQLTPFMAGYRDRPGKWN